MKIRPQATVKDSLTVQTENKRNKKAISAPRQNLVEKGEFFQNPVVRNFRTTAADSRPCDMLHYDSEHLKNFFGEGELDPKSVVRNFRTTAADGKIYATERYDSFDAKRRQEEAIAADVEDLKAIEDLEKELKRKGGERE